MFGLGMSEILLILVIALIFIGPQRLPDLARSLARGYAEFRRSFDEVKNSIEKDIRIIETEQLLKSGKPFPLPTALDPAPSPYPEESGKLTPPPPPNEPAATGNTEAKP